MSQSQHVGCTTVLLKKCCHVVVGTTRIIMAVMMHNVGRSWNTALPRNCVPGRNSVTYIFTHLHPLRIGMVFECNIMMFTAFIWAYDVRDVKSHSQTTILKISEEVLMKVQNLAPQRTVLYLRVRLQSMRCDIITRMKSSKFSAHLRPRTKKTAQTSMTYATFFVSSFWTRTKLLELHKLATYTFGRVSHVWFPRLQRSRDILLKMQLTSPAAQGFVWRKMRLRRPKVVPPNSKHGTLNPSGPSSFTNVHDVALILWASRAGQVQLQCFCELGNPKSIKVMVFVSKTLI